MPALDTPADRKRHLDAIGSWVRPRIAAAPWTWTYGLARSLLAAALGGTLLATPASALFSPAAGLPDGTPCTGPTGLSLFCADGTAHRQLLAWLAAALCAVIASGWRPRWTGAVHLYLAFSFFSAATIQDGGDQAALVLSALLLPVCLTDGRRWHWSAVRATDGEPGWCKLVGHGALFLAKAQVAAIYLDASISKIGVPQWADGTAMYYILGSPMLGVPPSLQPLEQHILALPAIVAPFTWGCVLLELSLGLAWLLPRAARKPLFILGVAFHVAIAAVMGLVSFALIMIGALSVYLLSARAPALEPVPGRSQARAGEMIS